MTIRVGFALGTQGNLSNIIKYLEAVKKGKNPAHLAELSEKSGLNPGEIVTHLHQLAQLWDTHTGFLLQNLSVTKPNDTYFDITTIRFSQNGATLLVSGLILCTVGCDGLGLGGLVEGTASIVYWLWDVFIIFRRYSRRLSSFNSY